MLTREEKLARGRASNKKWRLSNPDKVRENTLQFHRNNPEYMPRYRREYYLKNVDRSKARSIEKRYGIALEEYQKIIARQSGVCAICSVAPDPSRTGRGSVGTLTVDHNHETGVVRGLLCPQCNSALGLLRDSPTLIMRALAYLSAGGCFEISDKMD